MIKLLIFEKTSVIKYIFFDKFGLADTLKSLENEHEIWFWIYLENVFWWEFYQVSVWSSYPNACIPNFTERKSTPSFVFLAISTNKNYHGIEKNLRSFFVWLSYKNYLRKTVKYWK